MNRSEALETLLAGKKVSYQNFAGGYQYVIHLKDNHIIYDDNSRTPLEVWLKSAVQIFTEYVEKPKKVLLKDVPNGSLVRMVFNGEPYGGTYLKINKGIVSDSFYLQASSSDNSEVKVVGEVKW